MPHRYRKKPVEVEAAHFKCNKATGEDNGPVIAEWCGGRYIPAVDAEEFEDGKGHPAQEAHILIDTKEGTMMASMGDYVIRGVVGEHYPCKPDIFEQTYELVEEEGPANG